jgi:hypothetical protein
MRDLQMSIPRRYESWIIRRESWLPPFPLTRRYDRDREATGRFEK